MPYTSCFNLYRTRSAIVTHRRLCCLANSSSCGVLDMLPSSGFTISHRTPACTTKGSGTPSKNPEQPFSPPCGVRAFDSPSNLPYKPVHIVATKKTRHGVSTRMSEAVLSGIAMFDGGNRQISARAPLDTPKFCE